MSLFKLHLQFPDFSDGDAETLGYRDELLIEVERFRACDRKGLCASVSLSLELFPSMLNLRPVKCCI